LTGWARRLPRLVVPVACGGTTHTVLVRRGQVVLVDHDRAGEAALRALGGEEPACAAVLRRWRERSVRSGPVGLPDALEDLRAWTLCRTAERARARGTSTGFHLERQVGEAAVRAMARWASAAGESGRQPLAFGCRIDWSGGLPLMSEETLGFYYTKYPESTWGL